MLRGAPERPASAASARSTSIGEPLWRESEDRRNQSLSVDASAQKEERINAKRLQGGSRFNLKYTSAVPSEALTREAVMAALAQYVTFPRSSFGSAANRR